MLSWKESEEPSSTRREIVAQVSERRVYVERLHRDACETVPSGSTELAGELGFEPRMLVRTIECFHMGSER